MRFPASSSWFAEAGVFRGHSSAMRPNGCHASLLLAEPALTAGDARPRISRPNQIFGDSCESDRDLPSAIPRIHAASRSSNSLRRRYLQSVGVGPVTRSFSARTSTAQVPSGNLV